MNGQAMTNTRKWGLQVVAALVVVAAGWDGWAPWGMASDADEFKISRQGIFEFEQKPSVVRRGDHVAVSFQTRAYCDVTVAVEDSRGRIIRHLASGVLGANAPAPLATNSLAQTVVWDGKDEGGRYIDDKDGLSIRVSLGLKPVFERTLHWSPHRRLQRQPPLMCAAPEGVYVYQGRVMDSVVRFGHEGGYAGTVYPFPAAKIESFGDLHWKVFPQDGRQWPLKEGFHQATLLNSGNNAGFDGVGVDKHGSDRLFPEANAASIMAHYAAPDAGTRSFLALGRLSLNRIGTGGECVGAGLQGPAIAWPRGGEAGGEAGGGLAPLVPNSAALSPDGKWLYLAGYTFSEREPSEAGLLHVKRWGCLPGVARVAVDGTAPATVFAGSMEPDKAGSGEGQFDFPVAVACDSAGRIYVADHMNNRVQALSPEGKVLKSVTVEKPSQVMIHRKTGEVFVLSSLVYTDRIADDTVVSCKVIQLGAFDSLERKAAFELPEADYRDKKGPWYRGSGLLYGAELDSFADVPVLWIARELAPQDNLRWRAGYVHHNIRLFALRDGKTELRRDFREDVRAGVVREWPAPLQRQRLYVQPQSGRLYVAEGDSGEGKSFKALVEIDPATGRQGLVDLPFDAEDLAFDMDGHAYLRTDRLVVRYQFRNWQEVPWDYGEERGRVSDAGDETSKACPAISALAMPSRYYWHHGGLWVSPKGHLLASAYVGPKAAPGWSGVEAGETDGAAAFTPKLYPGRAYAPRCATLHIWNRNGHLVHEDAVPGLGTVHGVALDKNDNVYVLASATRMPGGKPYFNRATGTLMKFKPGQGRILGSEKTPAPVSDGPRPTGEPAIFNSVGGKSWVQGAEWLYGGVGFAGDLATGASACSCANMRFALDYFGRTFVPETDHYSVAVLDTAGNLILRVGKYGNADDGKPQAAIAGGAVAAEPEAGGKSSSAPLPLPSAQQSIGGDEVALFHAAYVAVHSDRRLFVADGGNGRILAIRLDYHANEKVPLLSIADESAP